MKLSKNLVLKFSVACLFSSLCILIFSFFTLNTNISNEVDDKTIIESESISWDEAQTLMSHFKTLQPLKIELGDPRSQSGTTIIPLEGFKIKASQLLEIINNNKSGNGGQADNVMFYFGATDPQTNFTIPDYRIIAVGEKNGSLIIPTSSAAKGDKNSSSVFDKADPCPPMCPNQ
jgi:hypothetical protein